MRRRGWTQTILSCALALSALVVGVSRHAPPALAVERDRDVLESAADVFADAAASPSSAHTSFAAESDGSRHAGAVRPSAHPSLYSEPRNAMTAGRSRPTTLAVRPSGECSRE
jgi:hypothetical protein